MKTENKYKNAREYIESGNLSNFATDAMVPLVVKRKGIYSIRKTAPKETRARLAWEAFRIARHVGSWGNLVAWNESTTGLLMRCDDSDREYFHALFDEFCAAAMARYKSRYETKA